MSPSNETFVPGNSTIKKAEVGEGYYCRECKEYVIPFFIRVGKDTFPACQDCFLNELSEAGGKLGDPVEYEPPEEIELVGEADIEETDDITEQLITGA